MTLSILWPFKRSPLLGWLQQFFWAWRLSDCCVQQARTMFVLEHTVTHAFNNTKPIVTRHILGHSITHKSNNSKLIITRHILEYSVTHNSQLIISQHVYKTFQNISGYLKTYNLLLNIHTYIHLTIYSILLAFYYYALSCTSILLLLWVNIYISTYYKFPFLWKTQHRLLSSCIWMLDQVLAISPFSSTRLVGQLLLMRLFIMFHTSSIMFRLGLLAGQSSTWMLCFCSHVLTFFVCRSMRSVQEPDVAEKSCFHRHTEHLWMKDDSLTVRERVVQPFQTVNLFTVKCANFKS